MPRFSRSFEAISSEGQRVLALFPANGVACLERSKIWYSRYVFSGFYYIAQVGSVEKISSAVVLDYRRLTALQLTKLPFFLEKNVKFYKIECLFTMALVLYTINPTKTPSLHHRTAIDDYSRFCLSVICHNYFLHVAFQKLWKLAVFAH